MWPDSYCANNDLKEKAQSILHVILHPTEQVIIINETAMRYNTTSAHYVGKEWFKIHLADFPSKMEAIPTDPWDATLHTIYLPVRRPPLWDLPVPFQYGVDSQTLNGTLQPLAMQNIADRTWILDAMIIAPLTAPEVSYPSEKPIYTQVSINLTDWTLWKKPVFTTKGTFQYLPEHYCSWGVCPPLLSGVPLFYSAFLTTAPILALKSDGGNGFGTSPSFLKLPAELEGVEKAPVGNSVNCRRGVPLAFNLHTGRLYVGLSSGIAVIQY